MLMDDLLRLGKTSGLRGGMFPGEFRHCQKVLGWKVNFTAYCLNVSRRTIAHYRAGTRSVHPSAALIMRAAVKDKEAADAAAEQAAIEEAKREAGRARWRRYYRRKKAREKDITPAD